MIICKKMGPLRQVIFGLIEAKDEKFGGQNKSTGR